MALHQFLGESYLPLTMDNPSTGIYRVNHTIGHTDYTVHLTMTQQGTYAVLYDKTSTYFIVHIRNFSNTLVDSTFDLSIVGNN